MASKIRRRRTEVLIPGIPANIGIQNEYARSIRRLIRPLIKDALKFTLEAYKKYRDSEMITNDAPIDFDNRRLQQLLDVIQSRFGKYIREWDIEKIEGIASKFIGKIDTTTRAGLMQHLKAAGVVIDFKVSPLIEPALREHIAVNVNLIKTIPETYFKELTDVVIDSALKGRDMASIYEHIKGLNEVTDRRAELIAIDQTNKATQSLNLLETKGMGIKRGVWKHIPGEKSSRKTHIEMDGKLFDLDVGLYDEDVNKYVLPGELYYCRCDFRPDISELLTNEQD